MLMMPAVLTGVRWTIGLAMMFRDLLAFRAMNALWIELAHERLKTGCIVGILALELHQ